MTACVHVGPPRDPEPVLITTAVCWASTALCASCGLPLGGWRAVDGLCRGCFEAMVEGA